MSGADQDDDDKQFDASQKRLDDARARGEIARSADLATACGYGGLLLAATAFGAASLQQVGSVGVTLLGQSDRFSAQMMDAGAPPLMGLMQALFWPLAPFFVLPGLAAMVYLLATRSLIFTPDNLMPKLSRISPLSIAKQKFGFAGLFEFAKSATKLGLVTMLLGLFLLNHADDLIGSLYLTPAQSTVVLLRMLVGFLSIIVVVALIIGVADLLWQNLQHAKKNRMSRKDMVDESRDQDGDPHMKAQRRQRGYDIATNQMLADVAKADVIVVNPTHFAVALKWNRAEKRAPVCLAKGTDEIAARIRERAAEAGIPIHSDPPTARALFATVDIGQEIRREHYRAVAAAIRFAEAMRKRARSVRK